MENKATLIHFSGRTDFSENYRVIYEGENKITIEHRYPAFLYRRPVFFSCLALGTLAIILSFFCGGSEESSEKTTEMCVTIGMLIVCLTTIIPILFLSVSLFIKNAVRKIVIDRYRYAIVVTEEQNGKMTSEEQYSLSSVKDIVVSTGDYGMMHIYLNLADKSIRVLSGNLEKTNDHRGKLELARRMSGLLGVPVIEKT